MQNEKEETKGKDNQTSSLVDKIQQLGQASVPNAPDSNIHVLSIIGQVEGHIQLPPLKIKQRNMNTLFHRL